MNNIYYPYKSDKPEKKFFINTSKGKRVYFGQSGYNDYTIYYSKEGKEKADKMKKAYISRHSKMGEDWNRSGIDSPGFWSRWYLWNLPTKEASYQDIKRKFFSN